MDRDPFLRRVGQAALKARLPEMPRVKERLPDLAPVDLAQLFRSRARDVDAVVHGPVTQHGVPKAVAGIAAGHESRSFMAWDDLPASGVIAALTTSGLVRMDGTVPNQRRLDHQAAYRTLDLGLTGADAGIAESGSVALIHGPGRPRMASLVPEIHIALLETSRIHRTLAHWANRHPETTAETTNLVLVTGPSRTGDIELQLNLGVHGPRHLHIVLIK